MSDGHDERRIPDHESERTAAPSPAEGAGTAPRSTTGDVLSLIEDVERHLTRIREVQNRQESEVMDLAGRQRSVDEAEAALASRRDDLEAASTTLAEEREALSGTREELECLRTELDERGRCCD